VLAGSIEWIATEAPSVVQRNVVSQRVVYAVHSAEEKMLDRSPE